MERFKLEYLLKRWLPFVVVIVGLVFDVLSFAKDNEWNLWISLLVITASASLLIYVLGWTLKKLSVYTAEYDFRTIRSTDEYTFGKTQGPYFKRTVVRRKLDLQKSSKNLHRYKTALPKTSGKIIKSRTVAYDIHNHMRKYTIKYPVKSRIDIIEIDLGEGSKTSKEVSVCVECVIENGYFSGQDTVRIEGEPAQKDLEVILTFPADVSPDSIQAFSTASHTRTSAPQLESVAAGVQGGATCVRYNFSRYLEPDLPSYMQLDYTIQ